MGNKIPKQRPYWLELGKARMALIEALMQVTRLSIDDNHLIDNLLYAKAILDDLYDRELGVSINETENSKGLSCSPKVSEFLPIQLEIDEWNSHGRQSNPKSDQPLVSGRRVRRLPQQGDCGKKGQSQEPTGSEFDTAERSHDKELVAKIVEQTSFYDNGYTEEIHVNVHSNLFGRANRWKRKQKTIQAMSKRSKKGLRDV